MSAKQIEYNDIDAVKALLVGRRIVAVEEISTEEVPGYSHGDGALAYILDNGSRLLVADADGGCACSNGCFYVTPSKTLPANVITNVEQTETGEEWESTIRLFVYTEDGSQELFSSTGGDNGYYGWGHHLAVYVPEKEEA